MISVLENTIMAYFRREQKSNCVEVRHGTIRTCKNAMLNIYCGLVLLSILTPNTLVASHDPWGENLQPKLHTDYLNEYAGKKQFFYIFI